MLTIEYLSLSSLLPYAKNSRTHSDEQIAQIAASIKEFGFTNPILISPGSDIIAGHGRAKAAALLKLDKVPCIRLGNLTDAQRKAYVIADNRLALNAGWDSAMLSAQLQELKEVDFDLDLLGFDSDELETLLNPEVAPGEGLTDPDAVPETVETRCKPGDLWILGNHRLLCGDSTNVQHVERLMGGEKAGMVFTDPPYRVAFEGQRLSNTSKDGKKVLHHKGANSKHDPIANDALSEDDFGDFMSAVLANLWMFNTGGWYICFAYSELHLLLNAIVATGQKWKNILIWMKNQATLSNMDYKSRYEPIVYGQPGGCFHGERYLQEDIWQFQRTLKNDLHPTMKPIDLIENAIKNSSKAGMSVLDLFLGSGSTLIACEKTGRRCFGMEIDPKYCDVILARWEQFTGKTATLETPA